MDKYSEPAIEKEAATHIIKPETATIFVFCKANDKPAKAHVSSTNASFNHKTIEPT